MARFQRLTRADLSNLTRGELLPRLEAEQRYWARKEARGLSEADQRARKEFSDILHVAINPEAFAGGMGEMVAWLKGERTTGTSYWSEKPGAVSETLIAAASLTNLAAALERSASLTAGVITLGVSDAARDRVIAIRAAAYRDAALLVRELASVGVPVTAGDVSGAAVALEVQAGDSRRVVTASDASAADHGGLIMFRASAYQAVAELVRAVAAPAPRG